MTPQSVDQLEDLLSTPTDAVTERLSQLPGDILVLGIAGKMGPSLARMIRRASEAAGTKRQVIGVSRFGSDQAASQLESHGIKTIRCDLLDEQALNKLPDAPSILYLAGMKFGSTGNEALTWAMNTYLPTLVCRKFPHSRIVALSTGNVYGLVPVNGGGSRETDVPAPAGEYAMSCLGRERMFDYFSSELQIPLALIRLNYACDLRYGVLVDLAQQVWSSQPIDLSMGHFNTIWQADANAMILQSFLQTSVPSAVFNVTGPELLSVREVCRQLGRSMKKEPRFTGTESSTALLNNAQKASTLFGSPTVKADQLIHWVAHWVMRDCPTLGKPTHFESREGKF